VVLLPDYCVDRLHNVSRLLRLGTPKTVTLVSSDHLKLASLDLLGEVVEIQLELVLHLLPWEVPVGHQKPTARFGDRQQSRLEIPEEHLLLQGLFEQEGTLHPLQDLCLPPL
jgi:hypothetical protein